MNRSMGRCFGAMMLVSATSLVQCSDDSNAPNAGTGAGGQTGGASGAGGTSTSAGRSGAGGDSSTGGGGAAGSGSAGSSGTSGAGGRMEEDGGSEAGTCPMKVLVSREGCMHFGDVCRYPKTWCTCAGHDLGVLLWECFDADGG